MLLVQVDPHYTVHVTRYTLPRTHYREPALYSTYYTVHSSRRCQMPQLFQLASHAPPWAGGGRYGRLGTRRTTRQGAAGQPALRPVHAARRPGMPRGRRLAKSFYSHAGVCVHAAMCLALALGRGGLAGVCLCQNCVRISPRPASSKLS